MALRQRKHFILLALLVGLLLSQALGDGLINGFLLSDVRVALALIVVFLLVFERKRERIAALFLVAAALAANAAGNRLGRNPRLAAEVAYHCLAVTLLCFAIVVILRDLFQARVITADQIMGAFCGYLLAGVMWANFYLLAERLFPGSFDVKQAIAWELKEEHTQRFLFNYFSFVTLTTLGYGDITPIRPLASSLAWLEAIFGQFYVAVIVAQLIGLKLAQGVNPADDSARRSVHME